MQTVLGDKYFLYLMISGLAAFPGGYAITFIGKLAMKMRIMYATAYVSAAMALAVQTVFIPMIVERLVVKWEIGLLDWPTQAVILLAYIANLIIFHTFLKRQNHETIVLREAAIFAFLFLIVFELILFGHWAALAFAKPGRMWWGYWN